MSTEAETRRAVEGYFNAWTSNKVSDAYALLASDLKFSGPNASYSTAEQFRPALVGFAAMTKSAKVKSLVVEGNRAAMLYDCELPPPVGTIPIASFFEVAGGKITTYVTIFDAEQFRKLVAKK